MFICKCVECGDEFEAKTMFAKVCSGRCRMRRYRRTDKGKANVLRYNKRVKRNEKGVKCFTCDERFKTNRGAKYCSDVCYRLSVEYKESRAKGRRKWKVDNKVAHACNKKVTRAVKNGRLVKVPCKCGEDVVEGHHEDYDKPYDVIWMCRNCHTEYHKDKRGFGAI